MSNFKTIPETGILNKMTTLRFYDARFQYFIKRRINTIVKLYVNPNKQSQLTFL